MQYDINFRTVHVYPPAGRTFPIVIILYIVLQTMTTPPGLHNVVMPVV